MVKLTIPMLLAIISMMLLGLVDSYFVALLGTGPLAAVSFTLPVTFTVISAGLGIGMSLGALVSRLIGAGKHEHAARLITDTQLFTFCVGLVLALMGFGLIEPIFKLLGATSEVMPDIKNYMHYWLLGTPFLMLILVTNNAFRAIGNVKASAWLSTLLAVSNAIFDPLLIFGVGPLPAMGVAGAALATLLAVLLTWFISLLTIWHKEKLLLLCWPGLSALVANWRRLLVIALPAMGSNIMTPVAAAILTAIIAQSGPESVAGFGVGSRIESVALILVFALSSVLPMFIGQNIGAGKPQRAYSALLIGLRFSLFFQAAVYLLLLLGSQFIASAFSSDERVVEVIRAFLLILPLTYGAHGVVILIMVCLNVLKRPKLALLTTLIRLLVLYVPLAFIGFQLAGATGMFVGAGFANIIAALVAYRLLRGVARQQGLLAL
ncbi:putative multi antimicrobial extrusion protein MatE/Na+-driven multidrug efflux pump [gamma proteobacterium IMCC2047]|nr:putative multi antimicrobial extrusion protein MatE/Na+-driven multidrug efflux pump [gamma proteobacterium IMCC2047]